MASLFAVTYAPTLILVLGQLFVLAVILSQSVVLSSQADRIRDLAQELSLLKWRLHQLEGERSPGDKSDLTVGNGNSEPRPEKVAPATSSVSQV
jgi:hypothetical protein